MKANLYIEYNPYTLETEIKINGKMPKETSFFNIKDGVRFQEWVELLPEKAFRELNESELNIVFKGINMDFEDLKFVCDEFEQAKFKLEHIPGEEIEAKEEAVRKIFDKISNGPIKELKGDKLKKQFNSVFNNILEVNVLATMSSGKSTVLNAILDRALLPSENKACTAVIFKIIDNDNSKFKVIVKDSNGREISTHSEREDSKEILDLLKGFNKSEYIKKNDISVVELHGNIPFVASNGDKLVLVDTPGPNNANNEDHGMITQKMIESSNKDLILYIMDGTTLSSNDSNEFLNMISESMKDGGVQSRDRFIFVLNKMDNLQKNESLEDILKEARELLKRHNIENPNIFPVSGLGALNLRSYLKDNTEGDVQSDKYMLEKRLYGNLELITNFNDRIHLEEYGNLIGESNEKIKKELELARANGNIVDEAIIHTGIRSLEEAISVYLNKYFKTAKIKNTSEAILGTMKSVEIENKLRKDIMETKDSRDLAKKNIDRVKKELESGKKAESLYRRVNAINLEENFEELGKDLSKEYDQWIVRFIDENRNKNLEKDKAYKELNNIQKVISVNERRYLIKMEKQIEDILIKESEEIINEYKRYLREISKELSFENVDFNMEGVLENKISLIEQETINEIVDKSTYTEEVIVGTETRTNHSRKWYKPWTLMQSKYYTVDIREDKEFVQIGKVLEGMALSIEEAFMNNIGNATKEGLHRQLALKVSYKESLKELENELNIKLEDYSDLTRNLVGLEGKLKELNQVARFVNNVNTMVLELKKL